MPERKNCAVNTTCSTWPENNLRLYIYILYAGSTDLLSLSSSATGPHPTYPGARHLDTLFSSGSPALTCLPPGTSALPKVGAWQAAVGMLPRVPPAGRFTRVGKGTFRPVVAVGAQTGLDLRNTQRATS